MIVPSRRGFLFGAGALLAAPAIVRASNLMPVSVLPTQWWSAGISYRPMTQGITVTNHGELPLFFNARWVAPGATETIYNEAHLLRAV
jgi:hypothetical protein